MKKLISFIPFILLSCDNYQSQQNTIKTSSITKNSKQQDIISESITYDEYIKAGEQHLKDNNIDYAIKEFNQAIKLDNKRVEAHYGLGVSKAIICFNNNNLCNEAIIDLNTVISINPNYKKAYFNISICKTKISDFKGALDALDKAINQDPNDPDYYINKGSIYLILNETAKACENFQEALIKGSNSAKEKIKLYCE